MYLPNVKFLGQLKQMLWEFSLSYLNIDKKGCNKISSKCDKLKVHSGVELAQNVSNTDVLCDLVDRI